MAEHLRTREQHALSTLLAIYRGKACRAPTDIIRDT